MTEIKFYKSPIKSLRLFLLSSLFVIPCAWFIFIEGDNSWKLWFPLCFFGLGYMVSLFHFLDRRVQIIINRNGIWDRTTKLGLIEWELIESAYEIEIQKQKFISIVGAEKLKSRKKVYSWATSLNRSVGAQDVNLNVSQIKVDAGKLVKLIDILKSEASEKRDEVLAMYKDRL
ncbi:STM3941 family protein [Flavobacterium sp.]|uniref:STM3941 family protein n=1 Tax=Flavobacterium sp. TaxID=239 RepID=UPI0039E59E8E